MTRGEKRLAAFAADLAFADVPEDTRDRAGLTVADTVGAIVGGSTDEATDSLGRAWASSGRATVLGTDVETDPYRAAFLNATAGTVLELDEGHRFAGGHPAIHVLPAVLAAAEADYGNRERFLTAFVAGYEVAARVGTATRPLADGYHPHGVWGAVGGAAAVARYRRLDRGTVRTAMAIAAGYAQHTRFAAATEGATARNTYAGMSNLAALVAADAAAAGFTGLDGGVGRHLSLAAAAGVDRSGLTAALGERWEVERGYFKRHAACRYTHPVLDALDALADRVALDPGRVESVDVATYPAAARLTENDPETDLGARFSIPAAVAAALTAGGTGPDAVREALEDPAATALADRVSVAVDDEFAARAPDRRGARVTVTLSDGQEVAESVPAARGGEHDPYSEAELHEKFVSLAGPVIGADRAEEAWTTAREPAAPRVICAVTRR